MKTPSKRILMRQLYEDAAVIFRCDRDELPPTPTDVRCTINDLMDGYRKSGFAVHEGYSQEKAFREVRRLLGQ